MAEILLLIIFIICFTAPLFFITIYQWLNYKKAKKAKIQTDYEDELSLFIGAGFVICAEMVMIMNIIFTTVMNF